MEAGTSWERIDDPQAAGTTVVTSANIHKALVGYYIDASGVAQALWPRLRPARCATRTKSEAEAAPQSQRRRRTLPGGAVDEHDGPMVTDAAS